MKFGSGSVRSWHIGVVLLIVLALCTSVSTRVFQSAAIAHATVQSYPSHAMRQHMAADAAVFERPACEMGEVLLPVAASHTPAELPRVRSAELLDSLYNRPPPNFSLL